jgi:hypothetical protein
VNGLTPDPNISNNPIHLFAQGWTVTNLQQATPFVQKLSLQVPSTLTALTNFACSPNLTDPLCSAGLGLYYGLGAVNLAPVGAGSAVVYVNR